MGDVGWKEWVEQYLDGFDEDLLEEVDKYGYVRPDKYKVPAKPFIKEKKCECGKDRHGFASHAEWCAKYKEDK